MDTLTQDLRYAVRMLLKKPAFTALAVLTLALGIGMTSAMFSFVDAVLLKPLDYKDAESLVEIWERYPKGGTSSPSPPTYFEWKELNRVFSHVSIYGNAVGLNLSDAADSSRSGALCFRRLLDMLGVRPASAGYQPGEDQSETNSSLF
jgi:putative ABC transport system permease protein